jgi:hypothetical protein
MNRGRRKGSNRRPLHYWSDIVEIVEAEIRREIRPPWDFRAPPPRMVSRACMRIMKGGPIVWVDARSGAPLAKINKADVLRVKYYEALRGIPRSSMVTTATFRVAWDGPVPLVDWSSVIRGPTILVTRASRLTRPKAIVPKMRITIPGTIAPA